MSKHTPEGLKKAKSPFKESLEIPVYTFSKMENLINSQNIQVDEGTITGVGPITTLNRKFTIEKDRRISTYYENNGTDLRKVHIDLTKEGRQLLEYIKLYCLRENKLYFYIDANDFLTTCKVNSRTTYWSSKKDLIDSGFIAPTSYNGWFWINPKYIFKGDRSRCEELRDNLIRKEQ